MQKKWLFCYGSKDLEKLTFKTNTMSKILTLSKKAIADLIIEQEVSSEANYKQRLQYPIWPGGTSGVTIGLGYDIGNQSAVQAQKDLEGILPQEDIDRLKRYCGLIGTICKQKLPIPVKVSWDQAEKIFYRTSIKRYARMAASVYDELETLHPYEQTAVVGLVYNRGSNTKDAPGSDRRREMNLLIQAIKLDDDKTMAKLFRQMKRLWDERKQGGLIRRRELEAAYIEAVDTPISEEDKLYIEL